MNPHFPLVSIIVPNYNHERYLQQRLVSVFNQTYQNFEVILLDDCSTDASRTILSDYAKNPKTSHRIFNKSNSGNTFEQWNKGIALAKGEYVWIAESDDFCELNFLDDLINPLLEDETIVLAYCQSNKVNERNELTGNWLNHTVDLNDTLFLNDFTLTGNEFTERFLIYKNVIPNASGVVFRKKSAIQLGDLDPDPVLKTCGDWLFYIKLIGNNKMVYLHKSLNNFRCHSDSVIGNAGKMENRVSLIDIELKLRKKIIKYLASEKSSNLYAVLKINKEIIQELKYEKAIYYIRNKGKLKGGFILVSICDVFIKKYKFKKNIKIKFDKFFKSIYK
jgi:glycosyltransferase involved in cell wall biosynthesis